MSRIKIGVLISGGGSNLQAIIDNIENENINGDIGLVVSNKSDAYGLKRAEDKDIKAIHINRKEFSSEEAYNRRLIEEFEEAEVELIVLAGYLRLLSSEFIKAYKMKIINIHPSLIPSFSGKGYYGEKVHQAVLDRGVKITGATVHFVDEGTDTGPIILQKAISLDDNDDINSVKDKVLRVEHEILVQAIKLYCLGGLDICDGKVSIRKVQK